MHLSRRAFLPAFASQLGALALPTSASAQERPAIPFAFSLYGMRTLSLADALAACAKIGYDAVELALMPNYPAEPRLLDRDGRRRLRERLRELNLGLPGLMENLPLDGPETTRRSHLDRLQAAFELGRDL